MAAAAAAAIGLEVIKRVMGVSFHSGDPDTRRPGVQPILGLLIFIFTVSQFLLFLTAWAATTPENQVQRPPPVPCPAVIRPEIFRRIRQRPRAQAP